MPAEPHPTHPSSPSEDDPTRPATLGDLRGVETRLGGRIDGMETRFDGLEARFDGLEARFDGLEARFGGLEARFGGLEARFEGQENRIARLEGASSRQSHAIINLQADLAHIRENMATREDVRRILTVLDGMMSKYINVEQKQVIQGQQIGDLAAQVGDHETRLTDMEEGARRP